MCCRAKRSLDKSDGQRWTVTKYIYSNTAVQYNLEVLVLYLSISIQCYFHYFTFQRQILYFLHICLIILVTLQIQIINTKYNPLTNYDGPFCIKSAFTFGTLSVF